MLNKGGVMIKVKGLGAQFEGSNKYVVSFEYSQNYSIWISADYGSNQKEIMELLSSVEAIKQDFELCVSFNPKVFKYDLINVSIENVDIDMEDGDTGEVDGSASRDVLLSVVVSIYDFEEFNEVLNSEWDISVEREYEDDSEEASDLVQALSLLFAGLDLSEDADDYGVEFTDEMIEGDLISKVVIR
jgi:hypothetical protein